MNILKLIFLVAYTIFTALTVPAFIYWLHDSKKFGGSWICAVIIGLALALIWPVSILAVYFSEKKRLLNENPKNQRLR